MENIAATLAGPLPEELYAAIWEQISNLHGDETSG
jgi:hypothetical protein